MQVHETTHRHNKFSFLPSLNSSLALAITGCLNQRQQVFEGQWDSRLWEVFCVCVCVIQDFVI
jgi:hypothetical protein